MADKNMEAQISVEFEEATSRQSLNSGETINTLWSKVKRWLSDLKAVAFSGSYIDLSDKPTTATTDTDGLMSAEDKSKLDGIATGANKTVVDTVLSSTSTHPVQNKIVTSALAGKAANSHTHSDYALKTIYENTSISLGRKADTTIGGYSVAEGQMTTASGLGSHAEGGFTIASVDGTHAEGWLSTASGHDAHAEGYETTASGSNSHSEGRKTVASGMFSHAEGDGTTASGESSHAEGSYTTASGVFSHAGGKHTKALHNSEVAYGKYNESNDDTLFSIGDGTADDARHNAFEITKTDGKLHDEAIMTQNKISNSNLLINPDFKINQRGISNLTTPGGTGSFVYTVDRWAIDDGGQVTVNSDGTLTVKGTISQKLENAVGDNVTASLGVVSGTATASYDNAKKTFSITADNAVISWAKLEYGSIATPFIAPDSASELLKCQRYYYCIRNQSTTAAQLLGIGYAQSATELNVNVNFPSSMRIPPTVNVTDTNKILYSINGSTNATSVTAIARNGCMKPFNSITLRCTGTFITGTTYQIFVAASGFIEFSAEL